MEMFKLEIEMGNDAMQSSNAIADALTVVAEKLRNGRDGGYIFDYNGNRVGAFDMVES